MRRVDNTTRNTMHTPPMAKAAYILTNHVCFCTSCKIVLDSHYRQGYNIGYNSFSRERKMSMIKFYVIQIHVRSQRRQTGGFLSVAAFFAFISWGVLGTSTQQVPALTLHALQNTN